MAQEFVMGEPALANLGLGVPWQPSNQAIANDVGGPNTPPPLPGSTITSNDGSSRTWVGIPGVPGVSPTRIFPQSSGSAQSQTPNAPAGSTNNPVGSTSTPAPAITSGSLSDYFARAIIVILGLIFVAVGLNMLKPGLVPVPTPGRLKRV